MRNAEGEKPAWFRRSRRTGICSLIAAGLAGLIIVQFEAPAAKATASVRAWETAANAAVVGVAPSTSGISLTTYIGQAGADYAENESQASSAFLNLGGLGYVVGASPLCEQLPGYPIAKQPQTLTADSANGASNKTQQAELYPGSFSPPGLGSEHVEVAARPEYAYAKTYPLTQHVHGLIDVTGWASTSVRYVANTEQEADSQVSEDLSLLGGKVELKGLNWTASQHTGVTNESKSSFSYGSITIGGALGLPLTIPGSVPITTALKAVNTVLAVFGLSLRPPQESTDPGTGAISRSPLQLHFSGSSLDNTLLNPTNGPLTQLINLINGQTKTGLDCTQLRILLGQLANPAETVLQVLLSGAQGAGAVDVFFGGATANTIAAPPFSNPFALPPPTLGNPIPGSLGGQTSAGGSSVQVPTSAAAPSLAQPTGTQATPANARPPTPPGTILESQQSKPGPTKCTTTSPAGSPGCWRGLGTIAGAIAASLGAALLFMDVRQSRRRRFRRRLVDTADA